MAHLLMLADTYMNFHHCFRIFMDKRGQKYKNPWGLKLREIKLYDIIYGEEDEEQLLKDIKHFEYERGCNKQANFIVKWLRKVFFRKLKMEHIDMDKYKPTEFTKEDKHIVPYSDWFCYTKVIGKVKDEYIDGQEMI